MAITETTAQAPCPIFAGRGIDKTGFTLALPEKGYLSCSPDNIDSENYVLGVYNYDLATRVYKDSADTIAFGVWVETGSDTDAVTTAKHMHAVDFSMKVTEDYVFDAGSERNADIRCARVRIEALDSVDGVIHAMYLNTRLHASNTPTFKGRYLEYTSSYGGIGLEIRTEIIGETGTITLGDGTSYGLCGLLVTHKADAGVTAVTGAYQGIAMHCPYEGTAFSGATTGIQFINTVILAGTAWDVGIDFGTSMVVKAINIDGASVAMDADITLTTADNAMEVIVTSTTVAASGYIQALQLTVNHSTGALTSSAELHGMAIDMSLTGGSSRGVPYWYGQTIYLSSSADPVCTLVSAISIYVDTLGDAITSFSMIDMGINQTDAISGRFTFFRCYRGAGQVPTSIIRAEASAATNLISVDSSLGGFIATDSGSLTITHAITIDINGTTRYIPVGTIA